MNGDNDNRNKALNAIAMSEASLRTRFQNSSNEAEKGEIVLALEALGRERAKLLREDRETTAGTLNAAVDELQAFIATARTRPFEGVVSDIKEAIDGLQETAGGAHEEARDHPAEPAEEVELAEEAPSATAAAAAADAAVATAGPFDPINSRKFAELAAEYQSFNDALIVRPERSGAVEQCVDLLEQFRGRYEAVQAEIGVPWHVVGIIHGLESSFNFKRHLHNGDPLEARTNNVPRGRPASGNPPFEWRESAADALTLQKLNNQADWGLPITLFRLERYNGFGYRPRGVPTPYLWSFSNIYERGKFTVDHGFDPEAVSRQCGGAVMLKRLDQRGLL